MDFLHFQVPLMVWRAFQSQRRKDQVGQPEMTVQHFSWEECGKLGWPLFCLWFTEMLWVDCFVCGWIRSAENPRRLQNPWKTGRELILTPSPPPYTNFDSIVDWLCTCLMHIRLIFFKMKTLFKLRGLTAPIAPTPSLCLTTITICSKILWVALINWVFFFLKS